MTFIKLIQRYGIFISSALLVVAVLGVIAMKGIGASPDANSYANYAEHLIKHRFNLFSFLDSFTQSMLITYSVPIYVMAIMKVIFANNWKWIFIGLNVLCVILMVWRFQLTLKRMSSNSVIVSVGILLSIISIDHLVWPHFVLTDTLYSCIMLYVFTIPVFVKFNRAVDFVWFGICLTVMVFARPAAFPVVISSVIFACIYRSQWRLFDVKIILTVFFIGIIVFAVLWSYFFQQYTLGYIPKGKSLDYIYQYINPGVIIVERDMWTVATAEQYVPYLKLYFLRIVYFFMPYAADFSLLHNLLNCTWIGAFLIALILFPVLASKKMVSVKQTKFVCGVIVLLVAVASYHSAFFIDYDWRFRYPVILPMLMIVVVVFSCLLKRESYKQSVLE